MLRLVFPHRRIAQAVGDGDALERHIALWPVLEMIVLGVRRIDPFAHIHCIADRLVERGDVDAVVRDARAVFPEHPVGDLLDKLGGHTIPVDHPVNVERTVDGPAEPSPVRRVLEDGEVVDRIVHSPLLAPVVPGTLDLAADLHEHVAGTHALLQGPGEGDGNRVRHGAPE